MLFNQCEIYKREKHKIMKKKKGEIITYQPKTFEKSSNDDIKSVITEHPKTSYKLCMAIVQAEKVGSNCSLCSYTKNNKKTFKQKFVKITQAQAFKGYQSTYNVELLKFF